MELHLVDPAVLEVVILEGLPQQRDLVLGHLSPFHEHRGPQFCLFVLVETLILKVAKLVCKFISFLFLSSISLALSVNIQRSKKWLVHGLVKFATAVARLVCPDLLG